MWLQPSSFAILLMPYPRPFERSIAATSSGVCITSLRGKSPRERGCIDSSIRPSSSVRGSSSCCRQGSIFICRPTLAVEPRKQRTIYTAGNVETLPGTVVRSEGSGPSGDAAVDEAYDGLGDTFDFYEQAYDRNSIDDEGLPLDATVHYGQDYDNAFWNGQRMVFGDGDGQLFNRFTIAFDVIGHELTHGVTEDEAGFVYMFQPGALNESVSDVFGELIEQMTSNQTAAQADWLIGAGLLTASVNGVALRSMKDPGTPMTTRCWARTRNPAT